MANRGSVNLVAATGRIACLGATALTLAAPATVGLPAFQWSPWLLGLLALGVPHGAADHRVGSELGRPAGFGFYAGYLLAAAAVLALWFASPAAASVGFLVVAALHFGQGDVYWSRQFGLAARSGSPGYQASLLLARSALPIGLPLLAHPGELSGAADALAARLFGREGWSIAPGAVGAGLVALGIVVGLQVGWACWLGRRGDGATRRAAAAEVAETLLLALTFAVTPPVLALGVYFNAWHSPRHVVRLLLLEPRTRDLLAAGRPLSAFGLFWRRALPMTCGALAIGVALGLAVARSAASVADLGLVALVALSALTLPHVLVVAWMDARQGVWSPRPAPG